MACASSCSSTGRFLIARRDLDGVRRGPSILLVILAGALLLPAAGARSLVRADMDFPSDLTHLHIQAVYRIEGADAANQRGQMDGYGNRDGTVSASEAIQYFTLGRSFIAQQSRQLLGGGNLTLDAAGPASINLGNVTATDVEGPASSSAPFNLTVELNLIFAPADAATHALMFGIGLQHATASGDVLLASLRAPAGFQVETVTGVTANLAGDKSSLTFQGQPDATHDVVVAFSKPPAHTPSIGTVALIAMLASTAWTTRRRRRDA
jgi:hypothetical protein